MKIGYNTMPRVRAATLRDTEQLAPMLRREDLREIQATVGWEPRAVLEYGVTHSTVCFTVVDDSDRPLAIFGAEADPAAVRAGLSGIVWLLGSEDFASHRFYILRNSQRWIDILHVSFPHLWNYVDARNEVYIRWLKRCGFALIAKMDSFGIEGRTFYLFERSASRPSSL